MPLRTELASQARWKMTGRAVVLPFTISDRALLSLAPESASPALLPLTRKTPAFLILADYSPASDLNYHELAIGIFARHGDNRIRFFPSLLWVDSPESIELGHTLWALDKRPASFSWNTPSTRSGRASPELAPMSISVSTEDGPLLTIRLRSTGPGLPLPASMNCFSLDTQGNALFWRVRSRSAVAPSSFEVETPAESFLEPWVKSGRRRGFWLDPLEIAITTPPERRVRQ